MTEPAPTARMIEADRITDPRHRFHLGRLSVDPDGQDRLRAAVGEVGFVLGGIIHRHLCGDAGTASAADADLNRHVLADHAARGGRADGRPPGSPHRVVSAYPVGGLTITVVTDLAAGTTGVRVD